MKFRLIMICILIGFMPGWGAVVRVQCKDLEWTVKEEVNLEASPLDVATSADGKWVFVLVQEKVLVYSASSDRLVKEIQVDGQFDRVAHSPRDNTLILSSSSGKSLKFIELEQVYAFDLSGLPFKGPEDAAVTIAVFGDYQ